MAKRRSTKKQKKRNNQLIVGAVGALIVAAVIFGVVTQNTSPATSALPLEVTVQEAYEAYQEDTFILDVRTQEEWDAGHIPGATLIPLDDLGNRISELPRGEDIVVICRSGNRSAVGRDILLSAGFENVTSVAGGFNQWVSNGYPTEVSP
ncbi:MAG: rhodanese-like domain-containing protein [Anaerolineales bacterium]|nr:rhodanese-like domain-containing protein [Anaerolineales bacterium]